jgi:hypothetical protein
MATMENRSTRNARAELEAWFLCDLLPKLERAARAGDVDRRALAAFDAEMRTLVDPSWEWEEAAWSRLG